MKKVIESELGEPLKEVFSEFEEEAVAAASIGQVYRARLAEDDREVAVKVQYPGVASAVRADLQNMGLIMRVAKRIAPGMDAKAMAAEIRERLSDELDYEHEAQNHRAFARAWRGHPFIFVPDVVTSLSTEKVLVSEWVDGTGFEEVREMDEATRDRFGEIVFRFFFGSLYRNGHFSGDPHPGNYQLMPDGRVAFLDYGMTKKLSPERVADEVEAVQLTMEGDAEGLLAHMAHMGFYDPGDEKVSPEAVFEHVQDMLAWYVDDEEITLDRETAGRILIDFGDPRSRHWNLMRRGTAPPESMLERADAGADPRRAGPARLHGELAPHRARVAVRRPAEHPAGGAGDRVLRPRPRARPPDPVPRPEAPEAAPSPSRRPTRPWPSCARTRSWPRCSTDFGPLDEVLRRRGRRPTEAYGALLRAIVGQQLSTKAAKSIYGRLEEMFGGRAPTPAELLAADPEEVRAVGLSRPKVAYLRDLAEHVEDGRLELDRLARPARRRGDRPAHRGQGPGRVDRPHVPDLPPGPPRRPARRRPRHPQRGGPGLRAGGPAEAGGAHRAGGGLAPPPLAGVALPLAVAGQHAGLTLRRAGRRAHTGLSRQRADEFLKTVRPHCAAAGA